MAAGSKKGFRGRMALAAWGLAGLFLAADFFAEICPMLESGTLRKAAGAAVSAS